MDRTTFQKAINAHLKKGPIFLLVLISLLSCTAGRNETQSADLEKLEIGETVYVCGCPMMCCNSISKISGGRCGCNHPLQKGVVAEIHDGRVYVKIDDGREKRFFIKNR